MAVIYDLTDTWNNSAVAFNGIKINVTDTNSAVTSKLLDLQIGGSSKFTVGKSGSVTATGLIESTVGGFKFPDGTVQTTSAAGGGTVTSVSGAGTVSGLTLTGNITTSGSLTLGGTLVLTSSNVTTALGYTPATAAQGAKADTAVQTIASTDGSVTITGTTAIDLSVGVAGSTSNVILPIRNTTGATLTKGTAVYISGATGQISTVTKAIATGDATSAQTLGLVTANIANNANGNVTLIGSLTNIDTSAYADGAQLYLSPATAGALTATKPYAPSHLVYMAVVEHSHPTQGKLFVKVQNGYEMDELHNVSAQSPANNDGLFYNTSTSLWEKKSIATALGYTPYSAANPTGYITSSALSPYLTSAIAATTYQPLDGDLTAIAALSGTTGLIRKTAANTYTLDTATYLTGITSGQVTTALGFTPYDAANPAGYTSNAGTVTSITAGTGLSGGTTTSSGTVALANTSVTAGSYTSANITVDAQGRITAAANGSGGGSMVYPDAGVAVSTGTAWGTSLTAPSGSIVGTTDTQTLTNKRITPRISSTTSVAGTFAWNSDNFDQYAATAQSAGTTISPDAGTPTDGQKMIFRFLDNGTSRNLLFIGGVSKAFRPVGVTLGTSGGDFTYNTVANKTVYFGMVYNGAAARWDIIAISEQG